MRAEVLAPWKWGNTTGASGGVNLMRRVHRIGVRVPFPLFFWPGDCTAPPISASGSSEWAYFLHRWLGLKKSTYLFSLLHCLHVAHGDKLEDRFYLLIFFFIIFIYWFFSSVAVSVYSRYSLVWLSFLFRSWAQLLAPYTCATVSQKKRRRKEKAKSQSPLRKLKTEPMKPNATLV